MCRSFCNKRRSSAYSETGPHLKGRGFFFEIFVFHGVITVSSLSFLFARLEMAITGITSLISELSVPSAGSQDNV